jgi:dual specificity phosphatase 12
VLPQWTRWPSIPLLLPSAILPPHQVDTADERFDARCAGMSTVNRFGYMLTIRRQLAVREHMMDHILDQAPVSRPRTPSNFALPSPKFESLPGGGLGHQRRGSVVSDIINPLTGQPGARSKSRQNSFTASSFGPLSTLSPADDSKNNSGDSGNGDHPMVSPVAGVPMPKPTPQVITTGASPEVATGFPVKGVPFPVASSPGEISRNPSFDAGGRIKGPAPRQFQSADQLSSRLPPQLLALRNAGSGPSSPIGSSPASSPEHDSTHANSTSNAQGTPGVQNAARRMSMLAMTPKDATGRERKGSNASEASAYGSALPNAGPAILVNPKCSGYFVEPVSLLAFSNDHADD